MSSSQQDTVPPRILELIQRFGENGDDFKAVHYKEAQLRQEFIDPLFDALGWDLDNKKGYAEAYKEVIHEDAIKIGGFTKAPDYCFRIGGTRKFFVEVKKPWCDISTNQEAAYQLRRYAWSAKLPISILTNFEHLAIYDGRVRPTQKDKATVARLLLLKCTDFPSRWKELSGIFSQDSVLKGSFDKYADVAKIKKGTATVDDSFLNEIEKWRDILARNIALRNRKLSDNELNFAVQVTIDRIIFLRICEDRGSETYGRLMALHNGVGVYDRLKELFQRADERYNSGLFHFQEEQGRKEPPDSLTPKLIIDDAPLKEIVAHLYYPDSPFEFSVLPADILGQVYEQFLGKVIRLTSDHHAKIEEKPEVTKAGGIFYTPTYVVDYIVENTVGSLIAGKTPKQVSKIKVLDPACGSGSFLISAYQYLLDWHLARYMENGLENHKKELYQGPGGTWLLGSKERKRILLNNIYGVDIDAQAVEVTKLSLLLKVLEGENDQSIRRQLELFHERALPDLSENIKCGNSLIASDYYDIKAKDLFGADLDRKINVFDWKGEFLEIMNAGGFDVIIGNPPYIQLSMAAYFNEDVNRYLGDKYSSSMGRLNTFGFFIERSLNHLLRPDGLLGFIVPNTLLTQEYYQSLRQQILKFRISNITSFVHPVFKRAVVETVILVVKKTKSGTDLVSIVDFDNRAMKFKKSEVAQSNFLTSNLNAFLVKIDSEKIAFKKKLDQPNEVLGNLANINQAIALKHDRSKSLFTEKKAKNFFRVLDGRNIGRYLLKWDGSYLAYDVENIHSCKRTDIFEADEKIFFRRVGDRLIATYDDEQYYALNTLVVITLLPGTEISLKYLLALLNSRLLNFYYTTYLKSTKKVFSEIQARQLEQLPIKIPDLKNVEEKKLHDRIVSLAAEALELNKTIASARLPTEITQLQRKLTHTEAQIDTIVRQLYDLTEREVELISRIE